MVTIDYIFDVAARLDDYVAALRKWENPNTKGEIPSWVIYDDRVHLDRVLQNLAYTLEGKVDDQILEQMLVSLGEGKIADGLLIPALGGEEIQGLSEPERAIAIGRLVKAAAEFRAIAHSIAVRHHIELLPQAEQKGASDREHKRGASRKS